MNYRPGDLVVVALDAADQEVGRRSDEAKAATLARRAGRRRPRAFVGRAATYMRPGRAYEVVAITPTGGLVLRSFAVPVSPRHVRPA